MEDLTRKAVQEVFQSMVSIDLTPNAASDAGLCSGGQIAGSVGFIGEANGIIYIYAAVEFAHVLTARMLGISEVEVEGEEMVNDAMGELCNMVGGYVKSRLCDAGHSCTLSIPSIVRGQQLSIEGVTQVSRRVISFAHGSHRLLVELLVKETAEE